MLIKFLCFIGFHKWQQISNITINPYSSGWGDGYYDAPHYWIEECFNCKKRKIGY
jgi:hypothetical protein